MQNRRLSKISDLSSYQRSFSLFYRRLSRSFKLKSDLRKQSDFRLPFLLTRNLLAKIRQTCFLNVGDFLRGHFVDQRSEFERHAQIIPVFVGMLRAPPSTSHLFNQALLQNARFSELGLDKQNSRRYKKPLLTTSSEICTGMLTLFD